MKNITITMLLFSLVLISCFKPTENAKTGKIKGIARDAVTMLPITNVSVAIADGATVTTNASGEYEIDDLNPQTYELHFVKNGYLDNTSSASVIAGNTTQKDIQLIPVMPELMSNTAFVNFGTQLTTNSVVLSNGGTGQINWSTSITEAWLHANPISGSITDGTTPIALSVDRSGLTPGNYSTSLVITSNANSVTINILMTIPSSNSPLLTLTPTLIDFGVSNTSNTISLENNGTGTANWTITSSQSWIGFSPSTGSTSSETDQATITVNRSGMQSGNYNGSISVASNGGNFTIPITMQVTLLPVIAITANSLDFEETLTSLTLGIANIGNGALSWTASDNADWLTVQPQSGTGNGNITVNVSRTGLSGGNYTGSILISSNGGNRTVSVNMTVTSNLPEGVTLLTASIINSTTSQLNWTRYIGSGFVSYKVYRGTSASVSNTNSVLVTEINASNQTTCNDTGLQPQTQYYYRVYVKNSQNQMLPSTNILSVTTPPTIGQWYATQTISDLRAVDFYNLNYGIAAGSYGIYSYNGSSWIQENTNSGSDIKVISPTCVYTNNYYYNGITWTPIPYQYSGYCVTGTDPSNVWIGDNSGMIHFFNGSNWTTADLDYSSIEAIDALQSNIVYAVDSSGKVIKYNGIGWSQVYQIPEVQSYYYVTDMKVVSNGDFWVTLLSNPGDQGLIYHFTNDSFTTKWNIDEMINCVDALSSNEVWFGGYSGSIWYYDGSNLLSVDSSCSFTIESIKMIDLNNGWAVGSNGVIRYVKRGVK